MVVFLSANFIGDCLSPLCGETVSVAVVPVFEIMFLTVFSSLQLETSIQYVKQWFVFLLWSENRIFMARKKLWKKDGNFENTLMGVRDG